VGCARRRRCHLQLLPNVNVWHGVVFRRKVDVRLPGREFKLPWREAGPPNHHDDNVDSDCRMSIKNSLSLSRVPCFGTSGRMGRGSKLSSESGPLRAVHLSRHKWPGRLVNYDSGRVAGLCEWQ